MGLEHVLAVDAIEQVPLLEKLRRGRSKELDLGGGVKGAICKNNGEKLAQVPMNVPRRAGSSPLAAPGSEDFENEKFAESSYRLADKRDDAAADAAQLTHAELGVSSWMSRSQYLPR